MAKKRLDRDTDWLTNLCESRAQAAKAGDTDAARKILKDFIGAINQYDECSWTETRGKAVHYVYASYLAKAFQRILDGEDAAVALGIKSEKPGRRKGITTHNQEVLALAYWFLIRKGYRAEQAVSWVNEHFGATRRTVQRASTADGNKAYAHRELFDDKSLEKSLKKAGETERQYASAIASILADQ